jgi:phosphonate transport system permease protein
MSTDTEDRIQSRFDVIKRSRRIRAVGYLALIVAVLLVFDFSLSAVEFDMAELQKYFPNFLEALQDFFPVTTYFGALPFLDVGRYWQFVEARNLFGEAHITLAMGFAGTVIGFPLALLFGVLGSGRVTPFPFNFLFRGVMSSIRAIPAIVWALIYVPLGGLGPTTATLAIATDTIGNLGRLFTDELEEIEDGPIEAMRTTGGDRRQIITFGMLSQVHTSFIAWTLYIFEINVRIAVTLGVIGGGGLGQVLKVQQGLFNFTNMMATIFVIMTLILTIELFSQRIRAYLRADESAMSLKELVLGFPQRMAEALTR